MQPVDCLTDVKPTVCALLEPDDPDFIVPWSGEIVCPLKRRWVSSSQQGTRVECLATDQAEKCAYVVMFVFRKLSHNLILGIIYPNPVSGRNAIFVYPYK